jgi:tripartite-type tricarboxylate transporter receptor subunit TctC
MGLIFRQTARIVFTALAWAIASICAGQGYPERPIRIIVPTAAGGVADVCIRAAAEPMRLILGQPIVIENITGATGDIGLRRAVAAGADGYTLVQASAANTANQAARPRIAFDLAGELRPIGKCGISAFTLAVAPSLGVRTTEEFIEYAKRNQGKVVFASIGHGSSQHLVAEMFASLTKLDMIHVPYRGEAAAAQDMIAGRVHMMFMAGARTFVESGKLIALATTNKETWPSMPQVVPIGKSALPGFAYNGWNGLLAPKGTPDAIVARLSAALVHALADEKVRATLRAIGFETGKGTPEDFAEQIRWDLANFRRIISERQLTFPE